MRKIINVSKLKEFASEDYKYGKIWSEVFLRALEDYNEIIIPKGKYYIDKPLVVKSDTHIFADDNAEIILKKGVKTLLLRNERVIDGSDMPVPLNAEKDENISIIGGIWAEENRTRLGYGESGRYDENDSMKGVSTCFLFSNVKGLVLKNLAFKHTAGFAVQIGNVEEFDIENIRFEGCYADGLHVNGNVSDGVIKNLSGHTEDDLLALNMYDWDNSSINFGKLENVVVDGVECETGDGAHKSIRIQPGVYPYKNGEKEDCYVKNLTIRNVRGVACFKMYLQTPAYTTVPEKNVGVGRMENVLFENISADAANPVDKQPNYLNGDPVTGNFGAFEAGSNIDGLTFRNVNVRLDREKYPHSYFMTVGPKSQYIADKKLELFDPYVNCEVKNVTFENVCVNGEKVDNLGEYIKEIDFPRLYSSPLGFGKGVLKK